MIKRIQEIINVGTFANARPASIEFSKFTYIYGPNSQGKTTLCDIFKSLMTNDIHYVIERKTVGQSGKQSIIFNCGDKKEIKYKDDKWEITADSIDPNQIQIFDTEFVQNNVFTNSQIEHKNKENFTKFVIGNESVKLSVALHELSKNKKELEDKIDNLERIIKEKIGSDLQVEEIIKQPYKEDVTNEDSICLSLQSMISNEKKNLKEIEKIKNLPFPKRISAIKNDFLISLININSIFKSSISFSEKVLLEKFNNHKRHNIKANTEINIDNWLMQGSLLLSKNNCPFCGTDIDGNLLVESYIKLFSKEVLDYNSNIEKLKTFTFKFTINVPVELIKNDSIIAEINKKTYDENVSQLFKDLSVLQSKIIDKIEKFNNNMSLLKEIFETKRKEKIENIYSDVSVMNISELEILYQEIGNSINNYNEKLDLFSKHAKEYIDNMSETTINNHINEMKKELNKNNMIVYRNQLNDIIIDLKNTKDELSKNILNTKQKKSNFDKEQESYLNSFYEDINNYFEQFGSRNYKIKKVVNTRGTNKTYSLELYYKQGLVPSEKIQFVLSESDKRALALAIFFTKLKHIANNKTIIILDDPITSFDLERMNVFINKLKELKDKVDQIIITTHYESFFKKLVSLSRNENISLIRIKQELKSNQLCKIDEKCDTLLMDEYERQLYEMTTFMYGASHNYNCVNARTILQKHLEYQFAYELLGVHYNNLSELTKHLFDEDLIKKDLYKKIENKRIEYNDPAHEFDNDTEDQKRNSIIELYKILQEI